MAIRRDLRAASIISKLKAAVKVPVDFHTHCTPGYGLASSVMAIINGVDILDTNIWWFGGGSAAPAIELVYLFAETFHFAGFFHEVFVGEYFLGLFRLFAEELGEETGFLRRFGLGVYGVADAPASTSWKSGAALCPTR